MKIFWYGISAIGLFVAAIFAFAPKQIRVADYIGDRNV